MPPDARADRVRLGQRIKDIRGRLGMTSKDVAAKAGMSPSYLSEVEQGLSAVSTEIVVKIAKALGVSVQQLLDEKVDSESTDGQEIRIPAALSDVAHDLNLTYAQTISLLHGRQSLIARRSTENAKEWESSDWRNFYEKVKDIIQE